jgi:enoyl-[acyl-carrier protein] reductase II
MSHEEMIQEIARSREGTSKPFGVDLLTAMPIDLEAQVTSIIDGGASMFVAALGVPTEVIQMCHEAGVLVVNMCGKVRHAVAAVEAGCDLVVAQGTEAGGHTGLVATMPLVPQIVDAVGDRVPVAAAGVIFDGRGLAAALTLGADGVWIGTRFIATPEARVVPGYREGLLERGEDGTTVSRAYSGKPMRVLANEYTRYFEEHPDELQPFPMQMGRSFSDSALHLSTGPDGEAVDPAKECYPAGQGTGAIHDIVPAADLVARIMQEADDALRRVEGRYSSI